MHIVAIVEIVSIVFVIYLLVGQFIDTEKSTSLRLVKVFFGCSYFRIHFLVLKYLLQMFWNDYIIIIN